MKESLTNNLGLKLLSIGAAFFVWLVVVNISNPVIPQSKEIPVEVVNGEMLAKKQLTYDIVEKSSVTIRYEIHTLDAYKIHSTDFKAYIDLADLYEPTGSVPVQIEVLKNKELLGRDISSNITTKPEVLHVKTERLQQKPFVLQVKYDGKPEDGYEPGTTKLSVDTVTVSGPESLVGQINSVGIEVKASGASSDVSGTASPKFYDANGNELTLGERVTVNINEITYQTQILKVKSLTLDFEVDGQVADGYRFTGVTCDVKNVSVVGMTSALASVNTLVVPGSMLNIDGASSNRTVEVDLTQLLPANTTLAGDIRKATVTLKVEPLMIKNIALKISDITLTGALAEYHYAMEPTEITVSVEGLAEDLDRLDAADLHASLDVTGWLVGSQKGNLKYDLDRAFEVTNITEFNVMVAEKSDDSTASESSTGTETENSTEKAAEKSAETEILSSEAVEAGAP